MTTFTYRNKSNSTIFVVGCGSVEPGEMLTSPTPLRSSNLEPVKTPKAGDIKKVNKDK